MRLSRHLKTSPPSLDLFEGGFRRQIDDAAKTMTAIDDGERLSFAAFKEVPWREYGRLAIEQSQLTFGTPYSDNDLVKLMYRGAKSISNLDNIPLRIISDKHPELLQIITDHGFRGTVSPAVSLGSRLFHWNVLFKADYLFNYVPQKWSALAKGFELFGLDKLFVGRHILTHYRGWLAGELAVYIRGILLDERSLSREYLNRKALENMVLDQTSGRHCHLIEINKVLTLELVQRLLLEDI